MSTTSPRIVGIDPGINVTGYAVLERRSTGPHVVEAGVVRGTRSGSLAERLLRIYVGIEGLLDAFRPDVMALEELYSHYKRPRTAILMGHARGAICLAAAKAEIPVIHYSATHIKKMLTGSGRAPKRQIQLAIQRELALDVLPEPHDVADAFAVALCYYYREASRHTVALG